MAAKQTGSARSKLIGRVAAYVAFTLVIVMSAVFLARHDYRVSVSEISALPRIFETQSHALDAQHAEYSVDAEADAIAETSQKETRPVALPVLPDDFVTRAEDYLTVAYAKESEKKAELLFEAARETKAQLEELFGYPVLNGVTVRLARSAQEMFTLVPQGSRPPGYASGLAYSSRSLILLTERPRYPNAQYNLEEVFRHELAHIALHDAIGRAAVPRWFNEGVAVVASGESELSRVRALFTASVSGNLFPLRDLTKSFPGNGTRASQAYAQSADFIRFLLQSGEDHRFAALVQRLVKGQKFNAAVADAYASNLEILEADWRKQLDQRFSIWPVLLGGSFVWAFAIGLFFLAYFKRRRRTRLKLAQWAEQEARDALKLLLLRQQLQLSTQRTSSGSSEFRETRSRQPENSNPANLAAAAKLDKAVAQVSVTSSDAPPVLYVDPRGDRHTLH